ncbi:MAG: aminodeoxychorismate/anthranilate synthase component II [Saprospirales bacterium]|nr:MAG: aminodeoxychorismate/anthranilate synthase component II [Saprospirales bacterium]
MKIGLVDNYDSFSHLLLRLVEETTKSRVILQKNDEIDIEKLLSCDALILSPGPGLPEDAPGMMEVIDSFIQKKPILGVCLGHQALAIHFGCKLLQLPAVAHGKRSELKIMDYSTLFKGIELKAVVGRYHSWIVDAESISDELVVTAVDELGHLMGLRHQSLPIEGVQFHPESIMTANGVQMVQNFWKAYL